MIQTMNSNTNKINTANKKKIVKELSNEIDKLKEIVKQSKGLIMNLTKQANNNEELYNNLKTRVEYIESVTNTENIQNTSTKHNSFLDQKNTSTCRECQITFGNKTELKHYVKITHPKAKEIRCDECQKSFHKHFELEMHIKQHNKPKNYKFEVCEKSFCLKCRLYKHLKSHGDKKKSVLSLF